MSEHLFVHLLGFVVSTLLIGGGACFAILGVSIFLKVIS